MPKQAGGDDRVVIDVGTLKFSREMQFRLVTLLVVAVLSFLFGMQEGVQSVDDNAFAYAEFYCNQRMPDSRMALNGTLNMSEMAENGSRYIGYVPSKGWW